MNRSASLAPLLVWPVRLGTHKEPHLTHHTVPQAAELRMLGTFRLHPHITATIALKTSGRTSGLQGMTSGEVSVRGIGTLHRRVRTHWSEPFTFTQGEATILLPLSKESIVKVSLMAWLLHLAGLTLRW
jgi:hypothetical protein